ncbi:hypothetical protein MD484_g1340, partial [Candolleomyces efflorescens]
MSDVSDYKFYNSLPTIEQATDAFPPGPDRERLFRKIAPLLADFRDIYHLSLVHRHFVLEAGERMVATELITQPEILPDPTPREVIPSFWTTVGIPFEWTRVRTLGDDIRVPPPPAKLVKQLLEIVGENGPLGLSLAQAPAPAGYIWVERTDDQTRQHILELRPQGGSDAEEPHKSSWRVTDSGEVEPAVVCLNPPAPPVHV